MSAPWLAVPRSLQGSAAASRATSASALRSPASSSFSPLTICGACRRTRSRTRVAHRSYSSSTGAAFPQVPAAGVTALASRRLISVSGPDAAKYLQGVITSSMVRLQTQTGQDDGTGAAPPQSGFYSAFLSAQGRVLHDVFVYRDTLGVGKDAGSGGDASASFLIEVDADAAATLAKHIRRYKLRAKFDVRLLAADELTVWHGWGLPAGAPLPSVGADPDPGLIAHHDTRAPGLGWRFVAPAARTASSLPAQIELNVADEAAYRVRRYLLGVAEGQREMLHNQALPLESNMDIMGGIDFHKGCYVGQELTIRTRHRGVVRKRILPCLVYGADDEQPRSLAVDAHGTTSPGLADTIPAETSIGRVGKRGRSAGKWLSGVGNLGLALCRLETMTDVALPGEAVAAAATAAATFDPTSEFVMKFVEGSENDGEGGSGGEGEADASAPTTAVKIKAFVPDWLRQGLAPQD
ncbi:transferase caf17 [Sporothrix schenckii 1099-18]|uniref:Iron-sulfur cluster assembly factor IBA57 homolog, mitochondrial n=1 Tax=Sporothrix schenckii 1099-18 TaxID=1397361 RepID=A0A0F2M8K0_SPOSC|nr:transferase caf17 [Sporothrix schenckii 1099-18]KJR85952.1 transferase caf17 [Sporothrix schenckii 1099-18]